MAGAILDSNQEPVEKLSAYLLGLYDVWQPFEDNIQGALEVSQAVIRHTHETLGIAQNQTLNSD